MKLLIFLACLLFVVSSYSSDCYKSGNYYLCSAAKWNLGCGFTLVTPKNADDGGMLVKVGVLWTPIKTPSCAVDCDAVGADDYVSVDQRNSTTAKNPDPTSEKKSCIIE